jgi:hypothetical protein
MSLPHIEVDERQGNLFHQRDCFRDVIRGARGFVN